jgi:hypothetical protein
MIGCSDANGQADFAEVYLQILTIPGLAWGIIRCRLQNHTNDIPFHDFSAAFR